MTTPPEVLAYCQPISRAAPPPIERVLVYSLPTILFPLVPFIAVMISTVSVWFAASVLFVASTFILILSICGICEFGPATKAWYTVLCLMLNVFAAFATSACLCGLFIWVFTNLLKPS